MKAKWRSVDKKVVIDKSQGQLPDGLLSKTGSRGRRPDSNLKRATSSRQIRYQLAGGTSSIGLDVKDGGSVSGCGRHPMVASDQAQKKKRSNEKMPG